MLMLCLLCVPAFARTIRVDGYGVTLKEAENDAVRNAVENAVGALVDSTTLTQNGMVIEDKILSRSQGYVNNYQVVSKQRNDKGWKVSLDADVDIKPDSKLMSDLARMGIIDVALRNPRIAVLMSMEQRHDRENRNLAETAIEECLISSGFTQVMNVGDYSVMRPRIFGLGVDALRQYATSNKVDIIVYGKVTGSRVGDVGKYLGKGRATTGVVSYRAEANVKMYMAKTNRIVVACNKIGSGIDSTERMAADAAIKAACVNAADYCVERLIQDGSGQKQYIEVVVHVSDFSKLNQIKSVLSESEKVKSVQIRGYDDGVGKLAVQFPGSAEALFALIEAKADCIVKLERCAYDVLYIKAY